MQRIVAANQRPQRTCECVGTGDDFDGDVWCLEGEPTPHLTIVRTTKRQGAELPSFTNGGGGARLEPADRVDNGVRGSIVAVEAADDDESPFCVSFERQQILNRRRRFPAREARGADDVRFARQRSDCLHVRIQLGGGNRGSGEKHLADHGDEVYRGRRST